MNVCAVTISAMARPYLSDRCLANRALIIHGSEPRQTNQNRNKKAALPPLVSNYTYEPKYI